MSERNGDGGKVACLGMPCYGSMSPGAATGFFRPSSGKGLTVESRRVRPEDLPADVELKVTSSSLLAMNMNVLWTWALNLAHSGRRVDYFAMIHADIEPGVEFWLDHGVAELEAKGLDVLGVVAPIKDQRGRTSTAIDRDDGDAWRVRCRLTMKEVYRLPETFTSADLPGNLLINTGLWVCRFREEWAKKCHFTVNDRICFDPKRDIYFPQNEPEDWFISRLFHELKLRVGCTRKIPLGHRGDMVFGNTEPWGEGFDREYVGASTLDGRWPADWFPHDVPGWLTRQEGEALREFAQGKDVLEIGSYCGRSTVCIAASARSVHCIDPFDGRATKGGDRPCRDVFEESLRSRGLRGKVSVSPCVTAEADLGDRRFDLAFIDGAHDRENVERDIAFASAALRPGGLLAFHDYASPTDPDVTEAVDELAAGGAEIIGRTGSLAVVRPAAFVPLSEGSAP